MERLGPGPLLPEYCRLDVVEPASFLSGGLLIDVGQVKRLLLSAPELILVIAGLPDVHHGADLDGGLELVAPVATLLDELDLGSARGGLPLQPTEQACEVLQLLCETGQMC